MITVPEAARRVSRNPETIRRWIREGKLPSQKVGTQHLVDERLVDDLVAGAESLGSTSFAQTLTGEPMPDWVAIIRQDRFEH